MDKPLHSCCCLASRSETLVRWDTKLAETIQIAIHKITNPLKKKPHKIFIFWALVLKLKSKFPLEKVFWEFSRNRETFGNTSTPCPPSTPHPPPPKKKREGEVREWGERERSFHNYEIISLHQSITGVRWPQSMISTKVQLRRSGCREQASQTS